MDSSILSLVFVAVVGGFLLLTMFALPWRRLPEEKETKPLYWEKCSAKWQFAKGALIAGGNIPIARVSFYGDFLVIAMLCVTKIYYTEIESVTFKKGWFSSTITIHLAKGRNLLINPRNYDKVRALIEAHVPPTKHLHHDRPV
ncbi:MAG TPA: hypothetical protein VI298_09960 [Geobacteraceae bacterium]